MCRRWLRNDYILAWLALVLIGLSCRPLTPIDETRAVSVAWEMWQRHDFLVPYLNGEPYSHKPPLLQWCIHLLWLAFGVGEWSARLVVPLFALANLALTAGLARRLWRDGGASPRLAPWILVAMPLWGLWASLTLYDMLITFFTLLALQGVIRAAGGEVRSGWSLAGLAIGGGVLAKGPAILLLTLPVALLAPWWVESKPAQGWNRWYLGIAGATSLGALIALTWAIPAAISGGEEYRNEIFWGQSAGRIANAFAHRRPLWWYFELLPILLFPWVLWPPLWRAGKQFSMDSGSRFCAVQALSILIIFSLISGKQPHYLLPMFPSLALFAARALSHPPAATARRDQFMIGILVAAFGAIFLLLPRFGDTGPLLPLLRDAAQVAEDAPIAAKLMLIGSGFALLLWRPGNVQVGVRGVATVMLGILFAAHLVYRQVDWQFYDMRPFADRLAHIERQGALIVHWRKYNGDFNFLGRLKSRLQVITTNEELRYWMRRHPEGYVVLEYRPGREWKEDGADFAQYYRGSRRVTLWKSSELATRSELLAQLTD